MQPSCSATLHQPAMLLPLPGCHVLWLPCSHVMQSRHQAAILPHCQTAPLPGCHRAVATMLRGYAAIPPYCFVAALSCSYAATLPPCRMEHVVPLPHCSVMYRGRDEAVQLCRLTAYGPVCWVPCAIREEQRPRYCPPSFPCCDTGTAHPQGAGEEPRFPRAGTRGRCSVCRVLQAERGAKRVADHGLLSSRCLLFSAFSRPRCVVAHCLVCTCGLFCTSCPLHY